MLYTAKERGLGRPRRRDVARGEGSSAGPIGEGHRPRRSEWAWKGRWVAAAARSSGALLIPSAGGRRGRQAGGMRARGLGVSVLGGRGISRHYYVTTSQWPLMSPSPSDGLVWRRRRRRRAQSSLGVVYRGVGGGAYTEGGRRRGLRASGDSEVEPAARSRAAARSTPHGLPAPGYISPPRGLCEGLLHVRTKNRPALNLFCTSNRCTHFAAVKLFGGYMRERSKRQTSRWD